MEEKMEYRQQVVQEYRRLLNPLLQYLPWLESHSGKSVSRNYQGQGLSKRSISFPVYDATLMNFVREAAASELMDRNYCYVYTRNQIRTHEDEKRVIAAAELRDWEILRGILSKYVLEGMTKATLWGEAVQENLFVLILRKMRDIVEYWDRTKR